jgi:RNA polymerase sigma-70 factor (ECF subfamily)
MPRRIAMESIGFIQDGSLVREAQGGDHAAFAQLVHTYDQTVLGLALRLTGSESDAQDIHQEAFLKVYKLDGFRFECRSLPGFTALSPTSAWIACGGLKLVKSMAG